MEDNYSVLLGIIVLSLILFSFIQKRRKKKDISANSKTRLVDKASTAKSVPVSPVVTATGSPSGKDRVVKTIYRFIPDSYQSGDKKWKCQSCETENSNKTEYCKLCGTGTRNIK